MITVHRILLRRGLVRAQDRFRAAVKRFERGAANQLWQMDFKSPLGWDAPVGPLSILDDHSRYAIALHGTWSTQAAPVKQQLIAAFEQCGMPEEMLMDHGTPWWNMKAVTGWTWLTVWIMRQGIQLHFSGYRHPQTQGKVERFHEALSVAMQRRGIPACAERQIWLDKFRHEYNHERPHEALAMKTLATVWQKSARRYDDATADLGIRSAIPPVRLAVRLPPFQRGTSLRFRRTATLGCAARSQPITKLPDRFPPKISAQHREPTPPEIFIKPWSYFLYREFFALPFPN